MIVKGTKQSGLFRRGVNLYTPTKKVPIIASGLLLYLDANNIRSYGGSGSTWSDLALPGSDNITLVGSPTFNSTSPKSFSFNGSQYGTGTGNVVPQTAYTKCVWFKLSATFDNNLVSSASGSGANPGHFMYFAGTNKLYCGHADWIGGYDQYGSTATFSLNTWYFAVLTFNTTDGMALYINGVLDSTYTSKKTAHSGDGSTNIACFSAGGNTLKGSISMVMTYNRALNSSEVAYNYNQTKSVFGL